MKIQRLNGHRFASLKVKLMKALVIRVNWIDTTSNLVKAGKDLGTGLEIDEKEQGTSKN